MYSILTANNLIFLGVFPCLSLYPVIQQLDSIQHYASDNFDELSRQKKKVRKTSVIPIILCFSSRSMSFFRCFSPTIWSASHLLTFYLNFNLNAQMTEREKVMKRTFFSTIGSIFWVLFLFIFTYATIRLLPKPT